MDNAIRRTVDAVEDMLCNGSVCNLHMDKDVHMLISRSVSSFTFPMYTYFQNTLKQIVDMQKYNTSVPITMLLKLSEQCHYLRELDVDLLT